MELKLLDPNTDFERIKTLWHRYNRHPRVPYFLSWAWIENWLTCLPAPDRPSLAVVTEDSQIAAICFLRRAQIVRHHFIKSRGLIVNATGIPRYDNTWIEYNRFLTPATEATDTQLNLHAIIDRLPEPWDELVLPGLDLAAISLDQLIALEPAFHVIVEDNSRSPYVDLDRIRRRQGDYLSLLSRNTRSQIRRAYRLYQKRDGVTSELAQNLAQARDIFDEMMTLHRQTWSARGIHSPFDTAFVQRFHHRLIDERFASNEIQLIRIRVGSQTIGCLYNFIHRGQVFFYQSGVHYESDKRLKPGLISHVEAVRHNVGAGHCVYDFLGGTARYKTSLATDANHLAWIRVQRPRMKFKLENWARDLKKKWSAKK